MPTLGAPLDFAKYEARNIRGHQLGTAPAAPLTGQLYYNTADNTLYWWDGAQWVSARGGSASVPPATAGALGTIQLAGDLSGSATVPVVAANAITDAKVAAANKDGGAATPSMRTLGTGAAQAAAGNDSRFTDSRVPLAHHTTHEPGGADAMAVDAIAGTGSLRTLGAGAQQAMPGNRTLDAVPVAVSDVNLNNHKIANLVDPGNGQDAATKNYVDNAVQGLDAKASVHAATTANIASLGGGAPNTLDGVTLAAGDRVLVKDQTTLAQNGIYVILTVGTGVNGNWARTNDANTWVELTSAYVWVEQGTSQADTGWVCTVDQGGTLDTTAVTWVQFSGAGQITAGAGLTKTGNSIDVIGTANRVQVNADSVDISSAYAGQTSITTVGTVSTGTWNGSPVPVANGGTGQASAKAGRETGLGAAGYYNNNATHSAGTTITITQATHGLRASRALLVQVQDNTTGNVELPDINVAVNGDVTVTYGASVSANTKMVTIIG